LTIAWLLLVGWIYVLGKWGRRKIFLLSHPFFFNSRYDTFAHSLTDHSSGACREIFPGQDYYNPRIKDFIKGNNTHAHPRLYLTPRFVIVSQYNMEVIDKQSAPRMPWHDIHTAMVRSHALLSFVAYPQYT
jgi:hypothetical protein